MNLFIQINCLNEEESITECINDLPTELDGIDNIEIVIVDDGSSDRTQEVAKTLGVKHIVVHSQNRGLPSAVNSGIRYALANKADILINTDADGQYPGKHIKDLIQPILNGKADFVYAQRDMSKINHFSFLKIQLQKFGARIVSMLTGDSIQDAASGFRAMNREAMARIFLLSDFASPLETFIQAKIKKLGVHTIKIIPRATERPSRIVKSNFKYVIKSAVIILDNLIIYKPLVFFAGLGLLLTIAGVSMALYRYLLVVADPTSPHLTLLTFSLMSFVFGVFLMFLGLLTRINRANRVLLEEIMYRNNI
jgi:glycosyltransferase involved in cell wall biosynthesis